MRTKAALAALSAVFSTAACIDLVGAGDGKYFERETKHFTTSGRPDLTFDTFDGAIEVRGWDKPDVEVVIERRAVNKEAAAAIEIRAEQSGNQVTVTWGFWGSPEEKASHEKVAAEFMKTHPNIKIEIWHQPWDDYFTKLKTLWASGDSKQIPDVLFLWPTPSYAPPSRSTTPKRGVASRRAGRLCGMCSAFS